MSDGFIREGNGKFAKGGAGGPGRPKGDPEWSARCRAFMDGEGWDDIAAMASDPKHPRQFDALKLIKEDAYGKAPTSLEVSGPSGAPVQTEIVVRYVGQDDDKV